jgi:predicted P-loop ATPase
MLAAPEPSQQFHGADPRLGEPLADYTYTNEAGDAVMHVCQYRPKHEEDAPPVEELVSRYWLWDTSERRWVPKRAPPLEAPLFHVERLARYPGLPVYVLEGEESAQRLQELLDLNGVEAVTTTVPGGLARAPGVPEALLRAQVTIWVALGIEKDRLGAIRFGSMLWRSGRHNVGFVHTPTDKPTGFNAAVAIAAGWKWPQLAEFLDQHRIAMQDADKAPVRQAPQIEFVGESEPNPDIIGGSMMAKWRIAGVACAPNGSPYGNIHNVVKIIEASKGAYCDVWLDEFRDRIMTRASAEQDAREWRDADTIALTEFIQSPRGFGIHKIGTSTVHEAVVLAASKNRRNEVREWLESLRWDGIERLNDAFIEGWGTDDTPYNRAVSRCFIMGAAARILLPGCKVDTLPVFEGPEGIFKSTALQLLASDRWYDEPSYDVGSIDFLQSLKGKWILEFAEMAVLSGKQGDKNRAAISRRTDTYRSSYGRTAASWPRMCVFAASTNNPTWNDSEWGARRFWPVKCGTIDIGLIEEMREQWFAEAVVRVERGELWYDVPKDLATEEQEARREGDPWDLLLKEYLVMHATVEMPELLHRALMIEDRTKWTGATARRIGSCLRRLGWIPARTTERRYWKRPGVDPIEYARKALGYPTDDF